MLSIHRVKAAWMPALALLRMDAHQRGPVERQYSKWRTNSEDRFLRLKKDKSRCSHHPNAPPAGPIIRERDFAYFGLFKVGPAASASNSPLQAHPNHPPQANPIQPAAAAPHPLATGKTHQHQQTPFIEPIRFFLLQYGCGFAIR